MSFKICCTPETEIRSLTRKRSVSKQKSVDFMQKEPTCSTKPYFAPKSDFFNDVKMYNGNVVDAEFSETMDKVLYKKQ